MRTIILFEDDNIIVVHKPAGLATQSSKVGEADVVSELKNHLAKTSKNAYLAVVHRLDQPVEGVLVFAKTKQAGAKLSAQLGKDSLHKEYEALVVGKPKEQNRVEDYLLKEGSLARIVQNPTGTADAKKAVLTYTLLEQKELVALVKVELETGRFHQIRVQMAGQGHSLVGDAKYGSEEAKAIGKQLGLRTVALCATTLILKHPVTGKELCFRVEPSFLKKFKELA